MRTSWRSVEPKGIEDYLKDLCIVYRGEEDNPHDVNALIDDERAINPIPQIPSVGCGEEYPGKTGILAFPYNRKSR